MKSLFLLLTASLFFTNVNAQEGKVTSLSSPVSVDETFSVIAEPKTVNELGHGDLSVTVNVSNWQYKDNFLQLQLSEKLPAISISKIDKKIFSVAVGSDFPKNIAIPTVKADGKDQIKVTFKNWSVYSDYVTKAQVRYLRKSDDKAFSSWTSIAENFTPVAVYNNQMNWAQFDKVKQDTLQNHINSFFNSLFSTLDDSCLVSVQVEYEYAVSSAYNSPKVSVPILMTAQSENYKKIPERVNQEVSFWFKANNPPRNRGTFVFTVQISNDTKFLRPVMSMESLRLELSSVSDL